MSALDDARALLRDFANHRHAADENTARGWGMAKEAGTLTPIETTRLFEVLCDLTLEHERLATPPTNDERESLAQSVADSFFEMEAGQSWDAEGSHYKRPEPSGGDFALADAILAEGFRRRAPIADEMVNNLLFKYDWDPHFGVREFRATLEAALATRPQSSVPHPKEND